MKRVLVTGATGFIGNHVARRLCSEGFSVRVLVRPTSPVAALEGLPVETVNGDLTDPRSLRQAVTECATVFHVAADYRLWARNPDELYRSNVNGTEALLQAAGEAGVERFVYTSTVGTLQFFRNGRVAQETDTAQLSQLAGHYKRSKFLAEQVALRYAREGLPVVVVPMPIVREPDGLAMSSRNVYLSAEERTAALALSRALREARRTVMEGGVTDADTLRAAVRATVAGQPLVQLEYVSVADEAILSELERIERPAMVLVAAKVGSTRLIDNVVVVPKGMAVPEGLRELV